MTVKAGSGFWTLAEALTWMATRDLEKSARARGITNVISLVVHLEKGRLDAPAALVWAILADAIARKQLDASAALAWAAALSEAMADRLFDDPFALAWPALAEAIADGRVKATGRPAADYPDRQIRCALGAAALDVSPDSEGNSRTGLFLSGAAGENWYEIRLFSSDLIAQFPSHAAPDCFAPAKAAEKGGKQKGPNPSYPWDALRTKTFELLDMHGLPMVDDPKWKNQAAVERALQAYCLTKFGKEPAASSIRRTDRLPSWIKEFSHSRQNGGS